MARHIVPLSEYTYSNVYERWANASLTTSGSTEVGVMGVGFIRKTVIDHIILSHDGLVSKSSDEELRLKAYKVPSGTKVSAVVGVATPIATWLISSTTAGSSLASLASLTEAACTFEQGDRIVFSYQRTGTANAAAGNLAVSWAGRHWPL